MTVVRNQAGATVHDHPLRLWGVCAVVLFISLYLAGLPSSQASDAPVLSAALEDWDETDPIADKSLLAQPDHQPDVEGASLSAQGVSNPRPLLHAGSLASSPSRLAVASDPRAPPVR